MVTLLYTDPIFHGERIRRSAPQAPEATIARPRLWAAANPVSVTSSVEEQRLYPPSSITHKRRKPAQCMHPKRSTAPVYRTRPC